MEGFEGVVMAAFGASAGVGGALEGVKAVGACAEVFGADVFRDLAPAQAAPDERCIEDRQPYPKEISADGQWVGRPEEVEHEDKRQDSPDDREEVASIDVHRASLSGLSVGRYGELPAVPEDGKSINHDNEE